MVDGPKRDTPTGKPRRRVAIGLGLGALAIVGLFAFGVHVGARHPNMGLSRVLLWMFDGEAGIAASDSTGSGRTKSANFGLDGTWRIEQFEIDVSAPPGAELASLSRLGGLLMEVRASSEGRKSPASIRLDATCQGSCPEFSAAEHKIVEQLPPAHLRTRAREFARTEWVQPPTKLRTNTWWWHSRSYGESGDVSVEEVQVTRVDPRAREFLQCHIILRNPTFERADELIDFCKQLDWRVVEGEIPPLEARLGGRYPIRGHTIVVANPPPGFEFTSYWANIELSFATPDALGNKLRVTSTCAGRCDGTDLRVNLRTQNRPFDVIGPNRWSRRTHKRTGVHGEVIALRPGAERLLSCSFELDKRHGERADELEALCLDWLSGF